MNLKETGREGLEWIRNWFVLFKAGASNGNEAAALKYGKFLN